MGLFIWLLTGLAAGALAKQITPQEEKPGWLSSLIIGIAGALLGGLLFGIVGIQSTTWIGSFIFALIGSVIFLYLYHRYLKNKIDLGI
jgi:uncharacterized membrane protein YeaQ/YmgE (transglycosylase-associated protein family)